MFLFSSFALFLLFAITEIIIFWVDGEISIDDKIISLV